MINFIDIFELSKSKNYYIVIIRPKLRMKNLTPRMNELICLVYGRTIKIVGIKMLGARTGLWSHGARVSLEIPLNCLPDIKTAKLL